MSPEEVRRFMAEVYPPEIVWANRSESVRVRRSVESSPALPEFRYDIVFVATFDEEDVAFLNGDGCYLSGVNVDFLDEDGFIARTRELSCPKISNVRIGGTERCQNYIRSAEASVFNAIASVDPRIGRRCSK